MEGEDKDIREVIARVVDVSDLPLSVALQSLQLLLIPVLQTWLAILRDATPLLRSICLGHMLRLQGRALYGRYAPVSLCASIKASKTYLPSRASCNTDDNISNH